MDGQSRRSFSPENTGLLIGLGGSEFCLEEAYVVKKKPSLFDRFFNLGNSELGEVA